MEVCEISLGFVVLYLPITIAIQNALWLEDGFAVFCVAVLHNKGKG